MRYFENLRQDWIGEMLKIYGFIQRRHIQKKFGISTPQASQDIQKWMEANPGGAIYNKSKKRYELPSR